MNVFHYSEIGSHDENEDSLAFVTHNVDSTLIICALADGQGGRLGGKSAAMCAVSSCLEKAQSFSSSKLLKPSTWEEIGVYVDQSVNNLSEAGFTTFIGMSVSDSIVVGSSSGDSAVVLVIDGKIFTLTDRQYKNPPIGSSGARLTSFSAKLSGKWKLLAITDGVWKFVGWDSIFQIIKSESKENLISKLRANVISRTKELIDDFSIILIEP